MPAASPPSQEPSQSYQSEQDVLDTIRTLLPQQSSGDSNQHSSLQASDHIEPLSSALQSSSRSGSVASIDFTRVKVHFSAEQANTAAEATPSMSNTPQAAQTPSSSSGPVIPVRGSSKGKTTTINKSSATQSIPNGQRVSRRQPWSSKKSTAFSSDKARPPSLDGSQGRRTSMPLVPGAYSDLDEEDEDIEPMLLLSSSAVNRLMTSASLAAVQPPIDAEVPAPFAPIPLPSRPAPVLRSSTPILNSVALPSTPPLSPSTPLIPMRLPTPSMLPQPTRSNKPMITIARGLYPTDSTGVEDSDAEKSMKSTRRRALGLTPYDERRNPLETPQRQNLPSIPLVPQFAQISPSTSPLSRVRPTFLAAEVPSPKTQAFRKPTDAGKSNLVPSRSLSIAVAPRRPSMAVQPIRASHVTIDPEDMPLGGRGRPSLSVQPIRRQSRSLDEDISSDFVKKPKRKSIAAQSPEEKSLKNSISGLERLMQEAVRLAKEAADTGRSDEVPGIMDEARLALHRASSVQDSHSAALAEHRRSASSSDACSTCDSDSDIPEVPKIPAFLSTRFGQGADGPTSDRGSINKSPVAGARAVWDDEWPHHRLDAKSKPDDPKSVDFAYNQPGPSSTVVPYSLAKVKTIDVVPPTVSSLLLNQQRPPLGPRTRTKDADPVVTTSPPSGEVRERRSTSEPPPLPLAPTPPVPPDARVVNGQFEGPSSPNERQASGPNIGPTELVVPQSRQQSQNWGRDKYDERDYTNYARTDNLKGKNHIVLGEGEVFSINHGHRRQPIARNWEITRKRFVASVTCLNTALIGILVGVYAGEVPAIQYTLADLNHQVILGNVYLYVGMAVTSFLFWPLPLLHGRKPYTLVSLGLALPLQIPQAIIVEQPRNSLSNNYTGYMAGLLISRGLLGLCLGFAHINFKATLLDLYGASLQSEYPHGEVVVVDDVRRHGGGMGYWLGIWAFTSIASLSLGFMIGAQIVSGINQSWGFYICIILIGIMLFLSVLTPETRRSPHRRTMQEVELPNDTLSRRIARGEIKMHVSGDGPKWWWEECLAGVYLSIRMMVQSGFLLMALYMGWIYAQIVLIIVLLGNLLSAEYQWKPEYVGLGVLSVGIGALLAVPNSKANFFSRSRVKPPRTDSMTFQPRFGWTSHLIRRALFMTALPIAGMAYTLASQGRKISYMIPIILAATIGYISVMAIAECNGIIMETFDTSDLQPGTNSRHRLQSLSVNVKRRRTTYTSYPRVSAGLFCAQTLGFLFAAAATGVGGAVTRRIGAQKATGITAGILFGLTILLTCSLVRFKVVQVIPNELFGHYFGSAGANHGGATASGNDRTGSMQSDRSWRAVVIGNPSGKKRRMSWLELGSLSRWTEVRRLNRLLNRSTTQALNPGWQ